MALPLVEFRGVGQGKAGKKIGVVEGNGRLEIGKGPAFNGWLGQSLELVGIGPEAVRVDLDVGFGRFKDVVAQCFPEF